MSLRRGCGEASPRRPRDAEVEAQRCARCPRLEPACAGGAGASRRRRRSTTRAPAPPSTVACRGHRRRTRDRAGRPDARPHGARRAPRHPGARGRARAGGALGRHRGRGRARRAGRSGAPHGARRPRPRRSSRGRRRGVVRDLGAWPSSSRTRRADPRWRDEGERDRGARGRRLAAFADGPVARLEGGALRPLAASLTHGQALASVGASLVLGDPRAFPRRRRTGSAGRHRRRAGISGAYVGTYGEGL